MSSTRDRKLRRHLSRTNLFYRVVPMVVTDRPDLVEITDGAVTEIIDTPFEDVTVVMVPPTLSFEMARAVEQRIMDTIKTPVLVLSNNLALCRVEGPLSEREMEEAFKGLKNVDPSVLARAVFRRQEEESEATDVDAADVDQNPEDTQSESEVPDA